jgi:hypothetical protein
MARQCGKDTGTEGRPKFVVRPTSYFNSPGVFLAGLWFPDIFVITAFELNLFPYSLIETS